MPGEREKKKKKISNVGMKGQSGSLSSSTVNTDAMQEIIKIGGKGQGNMPNEG